MVKKSRTSNSILNGISGIVLSVFTTLMAFVVRSVFIATLDEVYLGVNGLFSNIFTILALAELGIGNAIIFQLYKPIAENDIPRLRSLIHFYKRCYNAIALSVLALGLLLLPFLRFLVKTDTPIEGLYIIYILYLLDTVSSYMLVYKASLMTAFQRDRIVTLNTLMTNIFTAVLQIIVLICLHNFYAYLIVKIACTLSFKYILSKKVDKDYPYITKEEYMELDKESRSLIFKDVRSIFAYKVGAAVLNGSDNIIISSIIGTVSVGIYSNYSMVISAVKTIMVRFLHGFTASIGNLNAQEQKEKKIEVYFQMNYMAFALFAFSSSCLLTLMNDFISIWIGNKFLMDNSVLIVLIISFYISGMQIISITYRETMGIFRAGQFRPLITAVLNIALSIIGAFKYGVFGVFLATIISELSTYWFDAYLICKKGLSISAKKYYCKFVYYIIACTIICVIAYYFSSFLQTGSIFMFIVKTALVTLSTMLLLLLFSIPCKEFRDLLKKVKTILLNKKRYN